MASQQPLPLAALTTISALSDDLLREIFIRLLALPSLVRAAFACRAFLRAVRSSRTFRSRFRAVHEPPLLAFFLGPSMAAVPAFATDDSVSDLAAAFRAADFFGSRGDAPVSSGWQIDSWLPSSSGLFCLGNLSTHQAASYSPLTQALNLYPPNHPDDDIPNETVLEFRTLLLSSRVVSVRHDRKWTRARVAVFSPDTAEWQIFPEASTMLAEDDRVTFGTVVNGFVCWDFFREDYLLMLSTTTFEFSLIDVPPPFKGEYNTFTLGQTMLDGNLCIAYTKVDYEDKKFPSTLFVWLWTAHDGWMLYRTLPLRPVVEQLTKCSTGATNLESVVSVVDGFVYLSFYYHADTEHYELYLSFCLETGDLKELVKENFIQYHDSLHRYIMPWPPSLLRCHKKLLETLWQMMVLWPKMDPPLPLSQHCNHSEKTFMNDEEANVTEIETFLHSIGSDDEENSCEHDHHSRCRTDNREKSYLEDRY